MSSAQLIRQLMEDLDDVRDARNVLQEETEWTPWEKIEEELRNVAG